jgi:hypothetical protein
MRNIKRSLWKLRVQDIVGAWRYGYVTSYDFIASIGQRTCLSFTAALAEYLWPEVSAEAGVFLPGAPGNDHYDDDETTLSWSNMRLAKFWLSHCTKHHADCRTRFSKTTLPCRVLYIRNPDEPFLGFGNGRKQNYVTLSYKWGSGRRLTTTKDNIRDLQLSIPLQSLPKTFRHAIHVASALGFGYLWIDALCIQQDNDSELQVEIRRMSEIFAESSLTIFAAAGNDCDSGMKAVRAGHLKKPTKLKLKVQTATTSFEAMVLVRSIFEPINANLKHHFSTEDGCFKRRYLRLGVSFLGARKCLGPVSVKTRQRVKCFLSKENLAMVAISQL